jgi:hypothetical protein
MNLTPNLHEIGWPQVTASLAILATLAIGAWLTTNLARKIDSLVATTAAAMAVTMGVTIEGAIRLATGRLHAHGIWIALPAVVSEIVFLAIAAHAIRHARHNPSRPNPYLTWLWRVAIISGAVVALGGDNPAECVARFAYALVGPLLLQLKLRPADVKTAAAKVKFLLTPRQLGIRLGWIAAEDRDVAEVSREYQTRRIVATAYRIWRRRDAGPLGQWLRDRSKARAYRLALVADDAVVADAEDRILRAAGIVDSLDPDQIRARRKQEAASAAEAEALRRQLTEAQKQEAEASAQLASVAADLANTEAARKQEAEAASEARQQLTEALATAATEAAARRATDTEAPQARARTGSIGSSRPVAPSRFPAAARRGHGSTPRVAAETVERVASERARDPQQTNAQIAAAIGISEKQVCNANAVLRQQEAPARINGSSLTGVTR